VEQADLLKRGAAEFVGTFTLIFIGAGSIIATQGLNLTAIGLAHGLAIGVMVSALGHISGGHFNPAVTFGFFVTRRIEPRLAAAFWFFQLAGAIIAAAPAAIRTAHGVAVAIAAALLTALALLATLTLPLLSALAALSLLTALAL